MLEVGQVWRVKYVQDVYTVVELRPDGMVKVRISDGQEHIWKIPAEGDWTHCGDVLLSSLMRELL